MLEFNGEVKMGSDEWKKISHEMDRLKEQNKKLEDDFFKLNGEKPCFHIYDHKIRYEYGYIANIPKENINRQVYEYDDGLKILQDKYERLVKENEEAESRYKELDSELLVLYNILDKSRSSKIIEFVRELSWSYSYGFAPKSMNENSKKLLRMVLKNIKD